MGIGAVRYKLCATLDVPHPLPPGVEIEFQNKVALCIAEHLELLGLNFSSLTTECSSQERFLPHAVRNRMLEDAAFLREHAEMAFMGDGLELDHAAELLDGDDGFLLQCYLDSRGNYRDEVLAKLQSLGDSRVAELLAKEV